MAHAGDNLAGKTAAVSGSGNVALYAIERLHQMGVKVIAASDSDGTVHDADGIDEEKLAWLMDLKQERRGRVSEYAEHFEGATYLPGKKPWALKVDLAFPCATQNELTLDDAKRLVGHGVKLVCEGANMPVTAEAGHYLQESGVLFGPGKAANAGGVAVSGMEIDQNASRQAWTREEVDSKLDKVMGEIHGRCVKYGEGKDGVDYVAGANIAGFVKVADAMMAFGLM